MFFSLLFFSVLFSCLLQALWSAVWPCFLCIFFLSCGVLLFCYFLLFHLFLFSSSFVISSILFLVFFPLCHHHCCFSYFMILQVCFGRVFELRFGILTRLEGMYVCFCFQWGIQAWASKCFVCIFLFGALFVNRSAQKLKHMHVLSCSSFSVLLCGTVLHLKVEQVRIFFLLCSLFLGMQ